MKKLLLCLLITVLIAWNIFPELSCKLNKSEFSVFYNSHEFAHGDFINANYNVYTLNEVANLSDNDFYKILPCYKKRDLTNVILIAEIFRINPAYSDVTIGQNGNAINYFDKKKNQKSS